MPKKKIIRAGSKEKKYQAAAPRGPSKVSRINPVTGKHLQLSTMQDILLNQGYMRPGSPTPMTAKGMGMLICETFQVSPSSEDRNYSLIAKATSKIDMDNPRLVDPSIRFTKPGQKSAKELGMTYSNDSPLFVQDEQLTPSQKREFLQYSAPSIVTAPFASLGALFCAIQMSPYSSDNPYMQNKESHTRAQIAGIGKTAGHNESTYRALSERPIREQNYVLRRRAERARGGPIPESSPATARKTSGLGMKKNKGGY